MIRSVPLIVALVCGWAALPAQAAAEPRIVSLREALDLAQKSDPSIKAALSRETAAQSEIGIATSYFYPNLSAEALDSTGFPGSTGQLGVGGLMGSPFRSGLGAGVVLTQNVFDFGRTYYGMKAAESQAESQKQDTEISRYQLDGDVIRAYFDCALNRAQKDVWQDLERDASLVAQEVNRFVRTGQRSIVDGYLANTQKEEAVTAIADYETRERVAAQRLAVVIGVKDTLDCPSLASENEKLDLVAPAGTNPFIARAQSDINTAKAKLGQARAEYFPKIVGIASAGYLENARLVGLQNYSLGLGVSLPLFEGFRTNETVSRTSAQVEERDFVLQASQKSLDDLNQRYDELILSSQVRLEHLDQELKLARDAFSVAKKRYFAFQGTLVDVREALKNLARVQTDLNATRAQYIQAKGLKEVLNGAR